MIKIIMFDEHSTPEQIETQLNELIIETGLECIDVQSVSQSYMGLNNMDRIIYTLRFIDND